MPNLLLLTLLTAFPALSTDMYLPAIPTLQGIWDISLAQANLSLVAYFATFSLLLLVHGPLSDRFGRKPVLLIGIVLFIGASLLCAASRSISMLVLARMLQATGAAAASALSLALAKDLYQGQERQKVLAYIGVILPLCPMVAPIIGGLILKYLSWRWIFVLQGTLALVGLYGSTQLAEPEIKRTQGGVLAVMRRYVVLLKNADYLTYTAAFSIMPAGFFAFIAGSSAIYITGFGLSEQSYGLYFGFNALCMMAGSFSCARLCVDHATFSVLRLALVGVFVGGLVMLLTNGATPLGFMVSMGLITFFLGISRPIANHVVLDQVDEDVGAASALLTFSFFMVGALAMETISFAWRSKAEVIGVLTLVGSVVPMLTLIWLGRRHARLKPVPKGPVG